MCFEKLSFFFLFLLPGCTWVMCMFLQHLFSDNNNNNNLATTEAREEINTDLESFKF